VTITHCVPDWSRAVQHLLGLRGRFSVWGSRSTKASARGDGAGPAGWLAGRPAGT
jgi:hypothetical protein